MDQVDGGPTKGVLDRKVFTLTLLLAAALLLAGRLGASTPTDDDADPTVIPISTYTAMGDIASCGGN